PWAPQCGWADRTAAPWRGRPSTWLTTVPWWCGSPTAPTGWCTPATSLTCGRPDWRQSNSHAPPRSDLEGRRVPVGQTRRDGECRSGGLALVLALAHLLDELGVERRQVVRCAAGDQSLVHHHLLVRPGGTGVAQVGLQARERGEPATGEHIGVGQDPGPVADH